MDVEGKLTLEDDVGIWEEGVTMFLWGRLGVIGSDLTSLSGLNSSVETSLSLLWGLSWLEENLIWYKVLGGFILGLPLILWVLLRKDFPLNRLAPLLFEGTEGKYWWNESCSFLGLESIGVEGNGELSAIFLIFLLDEATGESIIFLAFLLDREIVWTGRFRVFREWGLGGVTAP